MNTDEYLSSILIRLMITSNTKLGLLILITLIITVAQYVGSEAAGATVT